MKSLLPSKEQIPLFITLAVVLLLGAGYYYVYLPGNENDLREWKFRTLQNVDINIRQKVGNGKILLQNYLKHNSLRSGQLEKLNQSLGKLSTENFPIGSVKPVTKKGSLKRRIVINGNKQIIIGKADTVKNNVTRKDEAFEIALTYDFGAFIRPLLPDNVFDNYIVVSKEGVQYETFSSGLDDSADSLLTQQRFITNSLTKDKQFGGIDYKLFIQPVVCDSSTRLIVIGLLTKEHYLKEKTKLPPRFIMLLMLLFTGILITFPIVKLYHLSNDDRLTASDALSCTVVSMLMLSLLFFTFLKYSSVFSHQDKKDPKEVLADAMNAAFLKEIRTYSNNLIKLDNLMACYPDLQTNLFNVGNGRPTDIDGRALAEQSEAINYWVNGVVLNRVFWMDETGLEMFTWKADNVRVSFPGKFGKRAYFQNIKRGQGYDLNIKTGPVMYVDQVVSWISGAFLTNISTKSAGPEAKVVSMSFDVKSLEQAKLPPGYIFAMIDRDGKVLYHSQKTKNLNENLFKEFSKPESLLSSIRTGSTGTFVTGYFGQEYNVRIKATGGGLPYYCVIMDNRSFEDSRDIDVYSFTFSMQILLLIIVLIQMLVVFFASSKRSAFKAQLFDTSWLSPKKSAHKEYMIATGFYLWIFIALIIFPFGSVICRLFMLLISVSVLPVFLNLLMAEKYKGNDAQRRSVKLRAALLAGIVPVILNIVALASLHESLTSFYLFQFVYLILPALVIFDFNRALHFSEANRRSFVNSSFYGVSFTSMVFSWMLVVNGLPIIIFFTAAYNYDQHLIARYKQLELANGAVQETYGRAGEGFKTTQNDSNEPANALIQSLSKSFYRDSLWVANAAICTDSVESVLADDETAINVLNSFHVFEGNKGVYNRELNHAHAFDFSFFFNNLMRQVSAQSDRTDTYLRLQNSSEYLRISSANLNFKKPPIFKWRGIFVWFFLIAALAALFMLVLGMIRKIFTLNLPHSADWDTFDQEVIMNDRVANHTFIIALPGSENNVSLKYLFKRYLAAGKKKFVLDLSTIPAKGFKRGADRNWNEQLLEACSNKYGLVIVNHFEYNFRDPYTSSVKLAALEKILHKTTKSRVIILSTIRPATLISVMTEPDALEIDKHSVEKWQYLMGRFHIVVHKLIYKEESIAAGAAYDEARHDSLTFKSQTSSYHYYFSIWQSLSREEKFLLFDLAEDGLVNAVDKNTLCLLINKGVIHREDGAMRLFSPGFRNFILTGIGNSETEKIMEKVNDNRNWNKIKMPLALVSLAILAFILSSQHETSTKLITSLGALAAVIPTIINFLATMGGANAVKKA
jgi:hypothetical protein